MTIAVWAPSSDFTNSGQFTVETLLPFTQQHPGNKFFIITDTKPEDIFPGNTENIVLNPQPGNALLKKIWWEVKLAGVLRKIKADYFISFEGRCSLAISIPQSILIRPGEKITPSFVKNASLIFVLSETLKSLLKERYRVQDKKIAVISPFAGKHFKIANDKEKDHVKSTYSDGKEFFLCSSPFSRKEDLIELVKSFSHFKKRQQSSFNLLLLTDSNSFFEKILSSYKYKSDIKLVSTQNDLAAITAAAYAVLIPFDSNDDLFTALNSMQSGVPVIAKRNAVISEVAGDAALYAEDEVKDVGDKMMELYKDETHRALLIEKGRSLVGAFTPEKTAELLWQAIMKGLQ